MEDITIARCSAAVGIGIGAGLLLSWVGILSAGMILLGIIAGLLVGWTVCLAWRAIVEGLS